MHTTLFAADNDDDARIVLSLTKRCARLARIFQSLGQLFWWACIFEYSLRQCGHKTRRQLGANCIWMTTM